MYEEYFNQQMFLGKYLLFYDKFIMFYVRFDVFGYIKNVVAYTFWRVSHYAVL